MLFQSTSGRTHAKSTKGYGLASHGSRAHLHILMRIDMLLPCLHDPACLFMCAGFSTAIMSRYRPVPESWWHLLSRDCKNYLFFPLLRSWKGKHFCSADKCKRHIWGENKRNQNVSFQFPLATKGLRTWTEGTVPTFFLMGSIIPAAAHASGSREELRINISAALQSDTALQTL